MAPFLGALAIILLVVIGIVAFNVFGGSDTTPDQQLQRQDYADFRRFTCRANQRNEADVLTGQRDSIAKSGERYVDGVSDIRIAGERATVKVSYHFDKTPDTTSRAEVTLVREDGAWKVCSS
jgi:hypothetical protein